MAVKIFISKELRRGLELWKFNNSLLQDENFAKEFKKYIKEFKTRDTENVLDEQMKWDFLKYEIRKFCIAFSKSLQKEKKQKIHNLESKIKVLETKSS